MWRRLPCFANINLAKRNKCIFHVLLPVGAGKLCLPLLQVTCSAHLWYVSLSCQQCSSASTSVPGSSFIPLTTVWQGGWRSPPMSASWSLGDIRLLARVTQLVKTRAGFLPGVIPSACFPYPSLPATVPPTGPSKRRMDGNFSFEAYLELRSI